MKFLTVPIINFAIISEDEDIEETGNADFETADNLLQKMREDYPDKVWTLMAVIDA